MVLAASVTLPPLVGARLASGPAYVPLMTTAPPAAGTMLPPLTEPLRTTVPRKPAHLDEPIDRRPVTADHHFAVPSRDRDGAEIDGRCETPVESNFFLAEVTSQLHGRKIEERRFRRLLELVCELVSEENPRHVRFDGFDFERWFGIALGLKQEVDLRVER